VTEPSPSAGAVPPDPAPRVQTSRFQPVVNRVARALLGLPGLSRVVGRRLITLYVVGRRTGRRYTVPVAYTPYEGTLLIGTAAGWAKNLRTGEPVEVRHRGRRRRAAVRVHTDEAEVVRYYAAICRDNRTFASFNRIALDADGAPDPHDLHLAWAAGARVLQLSV
jgi:deazaflavin-dependent oxidoreductase (nitroreductase family)